MTTHRSVPVCAACLVALTAFACDQKPVGPALPEFSNRWRAISQSQFQPDLESVWASGPDDVYVGHGSAQCSGDVCVVFESELSHFDGTTWKPVPIPFDDYVSHIGVWGSGPANVYAATGKLYHFDGSSWNREPVDADFVAGNGTTVYAADYRTVLRFDGIAWDTLRTLDFYVDGLSAGADGSLEVTSRNYDSRVSIWDGSAWQDFSGIGHYFGRPVCLASDDAYVSNVTSQYPFPESDILHWDGSEWSVATTLAGVVFSMWGTGPSDLYAVGEDGFTVHYDGVQWAVIPRTTAFNLHAVSATGSGGMVAAGAAGKVVAYDGSTWDTLHEASYAFLYRPALWAESPSRALVAYGGVVFRFEGSSRFEAVPPLGLGVGALAGWSLDDLFATSYNGPILHYDGISWAVSADSLAGGQYAICTTPSGAIFSVGDRSAYRFDGSWEKVYDGDHSFEIAAASGADGIVAAGHLPPTDQPVVSRFDGSAWRDLPAPVDYYAGVWSDSPSNIWLAGYHGVYHWDGTRFRNETPQRFGFQQIFGLSPSHVVAFGFEMSAYFDGTLWNFLPGSGPEAATRALDGSVVGTFKRSIAVWEPNP